MALSNVSLVDLGVSGGGGLFDVLPPVYKDRIAVQWNREAALASQLQVKYGQGSGVDVVVSRGARTPGWIAESADVSDGYVDSKYHMHLYFKKLADSFKVTSTALAAAKTSGANASSELINVLAREMLEGSMSFASTLNSALYTGVGTTNYIQGLWASSSNGWLAQTGTIAGLDKSDHTYFKPGGATGLSQPTSGTVITRNLINKTRSAIKKASGKNPDLLVASPSAYVVIQELFDAKIQYLPGSTEWSTVKDGQLNIGGIKVVEDKDISESDGYCQMYFLNTEHCWIEVLQPQTAYNTEALIPLMSGHELSAAQSLAIPLVVRALPASGDYAKLGMYLDCAFVVDRPSACAVLTGLSQSIA